MIVIAAAVRGHTVAGEPVAQPIKPAPQVGDCVTGNPNDRGVDLHDLPALPTGPCAGARFGEVVFIAPDFTVFAADNGPLKDPCREHVDEYLGTPPPPPLDGSFVQVAGVGVSMLGPDARQRAAGQNWAACMVMPISIGTAAPIPVDHSLKGAWQRKDDSRLFAFCVDDTTSFWPPNCRLPHRFEVLGLALGTAGVTQESVAAACRQVVIEALGSSAALDRGDLTTQVVPARQSSSGDGPLITGPDAVTAGSEYFNNCLTSPTDPARRLTAPLRGLGYAAVPLN